MIENSTNPIDKFVAGLLNHADLSAVSEAKREEYRQNILGLVQQKIGIETMKILPSKHVDEFISLTEKEVKPEELHDFFIKVVPDFDKKIAAILESFEQEFIAMMRESSDFLAKRDN